MNSNENPLRNIKLMWALLVLFPPAGIALLWLYRQYHTLAKAALSVLFGCWFVLVLVSMANGASPASQTALQASPAVLVQSTATPSPLATIEPSPSPSPSLTSASTSIVLQDFSKMKLTKDNVMSVLSPAFAAGQLKSVDIEKNSKGKGYIVDVVFNLDDVVWGEKDLVQQSASKAVIVLQALLANPKVDKVWAWTEAGMVDEAGNTELRNVINVCMTQDTAEDIDWESFAERVAANYRVLHDSADSSYIFPSIADELD